MLNQENSPTEERPLLELEIEEKQGAQNDEISITIPPEESNPHPIFTTEHNNDNDEYKYDDAGNVIPPPNNQQANSVQVHLSTTRSILETLDPKNQHLFKQLFKHLPSKKERDAFRKASPDALLASHFYFENNEKKSIPYQEMSDFLTENFEALKNRREIKKKIETEERQSRRIHSLFYTNDNLFMWDRTCQVIGPSILLLSVTIFLLTRFIQEKLQGNNDFGNNILPGYLFFNTLFLLLSEIMMIAVTYTPRSTIRSAIPRLHEEYTNITNRILAQEGENNMDNPDTILAILDAIDLPSEEETTTRRFGRCTIL